MLLIKMKQGDIYWAVLDPTRGREQGGQRPVLIISGNAMNDHLDIVITCPLSTRLKSYPGSVLIKKNKENGLEMDSEVLTFQIRTLSKVRLVEKLGSIKISQLKDVIQGLNEVLVY